MKIVPKDRKLIYAINIFVIAFLVSGVSFDSHLNTIENQNHTFFGNVHVMVASMIFF